MRARGILGLAAAALAIGIGGPINSAMRSGFETRIMHVEPLERRKRQVVPARHAPKRYRSRWKPARPKRRSNMLHVSRRARRKHRRARG